MAAVYRIYLKSIPNLFYIGSSRNIEARKAYHKTKLSKNTHHNANIQNAYNNTEDKTIVFEILEEVSVEEQFIREDFYIKKFGIDNLYNIFDGAGTFGDVVSNHPNKKIVIENIRNASIRTHKERSIDRKLELSLNISGDKNPNWRGGTTFCECGNRISSNSETCGKCRDRTGAKNPFFGKKHTQETLDKIRETNKNITKRLPNNTLKVSIDGIIYESQTKAARVIGCTVATISNRAKNSKSPNYFYVE